MSNVQHTMSHVSNDLCCVHHVSLSTPREGKIMIEHELIVISLDIITRYKRAIYNISLFLILNKWAFTGEYLPKQSKNSLSYI